MPRKVEIQFLIDYGSALPAEPVKIGELTIEDDLTITGRMISDTPETWPISTTSRIMNSTQPMIFAAIFMPSAKDLLESFANQEEPS